MGVSVSKDPGIHRQRRWGRSVALATCAACLLGTGCASTSKSTIPTSKPTVPASTARKATSKAWRHQAVALQVKGFAFQGNKVVPRRWAGSGVFVGPGLLATNAHVALRAVDIEGKDDTGRPMRFTKIVAVDLDNDIALLRTATGGNDIPLPSLAPRPDDPKNLRQTTVFAVGNTGGLGLSTYTGEVINVVRDGDVGERIIDDTRISFGASGGPLYVRGKNRLLGVDNAISQSLRFSLAIPSWIVAGWVSRVHRAPGHDIRTAFNLNKLAHIPMRNDVIVPICLKPGTAYQIPTAMTEDQDYVYNIVPVGGQPLAMGLLHKQGSQLQPVDRTLVVKPTVRVVTAPANGTYLLVIVNPKQNTAPSCAKVGVAQIDWGKIVNPASGA